MARKKEKKQSINLNKNITSVTEESVTDNVRRDRKGVPNIHYLKK